MNAMQLAAYTCPILLREIRYISKGMHLLHKMAVIRDFGEEMISAAQKQLQHYDERL